jgi:signal transduction histidine kinase
LSTVADLSWITPLRSLRVRLPVQMLALVSIVLAIFMTVAYRLLETTLVDEGKMRAQAVATQIADMMRQSGQQRTAEAQRFARDPAVRQFFSHPESEADARAVRQRLTAMAAAGQPTIELWNAAGSRLIELPGRAPLVADAPAATPPTPGISALRESHGVVWFDIAAHVVADAAEAGRGPGAPLGTVVVRRSFSSTSEGLRQLLGKGAVVKLGNQTGGVWTDLAKVVEAPPISAAAGASLYTLADGVKRLGANVLIAGTPWAVVVEFPHDVVVAPARVFLGRALLIAGACILLATVGAGLISRRITTPLHELTAAAEAMSEGDYTHAVAVGRRDEIGRLGAAFNAMTDQVRQGHRDLERRVEQRVTELTALNQELEAFSYSVSHDLRAPLRHITGFAALLEQHTASSMDDKGRRYLATMTGAANRMGRLIDDLLAFSRMGRTPLAKRRVLLDELVQDVCKEVSAGAEHRKIEWTVQPLPAVDADPSMLRLAMVNLLSNAVKYTAPRAPAHIEIGTNGNGDETVVFVRDDGVGFDMQYAPKLFGVFQRLHGSDQFEGTGIGLANVRRIIQRHGGRVWAEAQIDRGATFYLSLPGKDTNGDSRRPHDPAR